MKTKKSECLRALREQKTEWVKGSFENPNQYMSKTILALHKIVLRERGAL